MLLYIDLIKALDGPIAPKALVFKYLSTRANVEKLHRKLKSKDFTIAKLLPEVAALNGVVMGAHHPFRDALDHTIEVLKYVPESSGELTKLAALFHDVGKAKTRTIHQVFGEQFPNHEQVSVKMTKAALTRLGLHEDNIKTVVWLVRHHGDLYPDFLNKSEDEARKVVNHPDFNKLLTLITADVKASGRDPQMILDKVQQIRKLYSTSS